MTKGTKFELTTYDKKGNAKSVNTNEIITVSDRKATIETTEVELKNNKETLKAQFHIICPEDGITIDLNEMLQKKMQSENENENMSVEITGTNQVLPNRLSEGLNLPEAKTNILIKAGAVKMKFHEYNTNIKVAGKETITTPAGTFDCVLITSDTETKTLAITKRGTQKSWFAEGVGLVKEENYNKRGKLQSYEELTKFSN